MFTLIDWRTASASTVATAIAAEAERWRVEFAWSVDDAWQSIEPARVAGRLPGVMAIDAAGRVVGWTCFLTHHGSLQIAVLMSRSAEVTEALVDAVITSPEADAAEVHAVCVRDGAPSLRTALAHRGFSVETYRYLTARPHAVVESADRLSTGRGPSVDLRSWQISDIEPMVRLCRAAYADPREVRAFAPQGSEHEWRDYVGGLLAGPGCGRLVPAASVVVPGGDADGIQAALIATDLGENTAHIAQIAVDPAARRCGIGTAMVRHAADVFDTQGVARVTLLVSEANTRAVRLYDQLGFRNRSSFVVAVNRQPRRFARRTSVAG